MPELPDVEATRRYLVAQDIVGRSFTGVTLHWPRAVREPSPEQFRRLLIGKTVKDVGRRAKFLLFELDHGTLVLHLRMTGSLLLVPESVVTHPLTRTQFDLDDGRRLLFVDGRKLGAMRLVEDTSSLLGRLGPEPLESGFTPPVLAERLKGRSAPIKPLLLEQGLIAGIGNIYADEVLFASGIHPMRRASDITLKEIERLHGVIQKILSEATDRLTGMLPIAAPPTESAEGAKILLVPGNEGAPCRRCGTAVRRQVIRGRSAYFCPGCQPAR